MSEGNKPDTGKLYFHAFIEAMNAGTEKGVMWRKSGKAILWADRRITELEQENAQLRERLQALQDAGVEI